MVSDLIIKILLGPVWKETGVVYSKDTSILRKSRWRHYGDFIESNPIEIILESPTIIINYLNKYN